MTSELDRLLELETEMNKLILLIQKSTGKEQIQYDTQLTKLALEAQYLKSQIESKLAIANEFEEFKKSSTYLKTQQELSQLRPIVKALRELDRKYKQKRKDELCYQEIPHSEIESILATTEVKQ